MGEEKIKQEIEEIEAKLKTLRIRWKESSPTMKKFIEQGARLHIEKKEKLIKKLNKQISDQLKFD